MKTSRNKIEIKNECGSNSRMSSHFIVIIFTLVLSLVQVSQENESLHNKDHEPDWKKGLSQNVNLMARRAGGSTYSFPARIFGRHQNEVSHNELSISLEPGEEEAYPSKNKKKRFPLSWLKPLNKKINYQKKPHHQDPLKGQYSSKVQVPFEVMDQNPSSWLRIAGRPTASLKIQREKYNWNPLVDPPAHIKNRVPVTSHYSLGDHAVPNRLAAPLTGSHLSSAHQMIPFNQAQQLAMAESQMSTIDHLNYQQQQAITSGRDARKSAAEPQSFGGISLSFGNGRSVSFGGGQGLTIGGQTGAISIGGKDETPPQSGDNAASPSDYHSSAAQTARNPSYRGTPHSNYGDTPNNAKNDVSRYPSMSLEIPRRGKQVLHANLEMPPVKIRLHSRPRVKITTGSRDPLEKPSSQELDQEEEDIFEAPENFPKLTTTTEASFEPSSSPTTNSTEDSRMSTNQTTVAPSLEYNREAITRTTNYTFENQQQQQQLVTYDDGPNLQQTTTKSHDGFYRQQPQANYYYYEGQAKQSQKLAQHANLDLKNNNEIDLRPAVHQWRQYSPQAKEQMSQVQSRSPFLENNHQLYTSSNVVNLNDENRSNGPSSPVDLSSAASLWSATHDTNKQAHVTQQKSVISGESVSMEPQKHQLETQESGYSYRPSVQGQRQMLEYRPSPAQLISFERNNGYPNPRVQAQVRENYRNANGYSPVAPPAKKQPAVGMSSNYRNHNRGYQKQTSNTRSVPSDGFDQKNYQAKIETYEPDAHDERERSKVILFVKPRISIHTANSSTTTPRPKNRQRFLHLITNPIITIVENNNTKSYDDDEEFVDPDLEPPTMVASHGRAHYLRKPANNTTTTKKPARRTTTTTSTTPPTSSSSTPGSTTSEDTPTTTTTTTIKSSSAAPEKEATSPNPSTMSPGGELDLEGPITSSEPNNPSNRNPELEVSSEKQPESTTSSSNPEISSTSNSTDDPDSTTIIPSPMDVDEAIDEGSSKLKDGNADKRNKTKIPEGIGLADKGSMMKLTPELIEKLMANDSVVGLMSKQLDRVLGNDSKSFLEAEPKRLAVRQVFDSLMDEFGTDLSTRSIREAVSSVANSYKGQSQREHASESHESPGYGDRLSNAKIII